MTINLQIPTTWNELTPSQIKKICFLFNKKYKGNVLHLLVFFTLINAKWYHLKKHFHTYTILKQVPLSTLVNHFDFIYKKNNLTAFIPKIKHFKAPATRLGNITINEFAHADDAYLKYHATKNINYLRVLAAVLYRETGKYNLRTPFIKEELNARLQLFKNVNQTTLLAVLRSYQGCRTHIEQKFPKIFPKKSKKASTTKTKPPSASQFSKLILELTGDKFGTYNETANTNVYTFLADFQNKLIAQSKIKK